MFTHTRTHIATLAALPLLLLASGGAFAQASIDDLAAAVDEKAVEDQNANAQSRESKAQNARRDAAPSRPLVHSYGASPRVSVNIGVPLGRHAYLNYSPAFGYYGHRHRGYYRSGRYCPPGYYGRRGRW